MSGNLVTERRIAASNARPYVGTYVCEPKVCRHHPDYEHVTPEQERSRASRRVWWRTREESLGRCWHESTERRLEWQGGPSANAAADLASWNALGQRRKDRAA